MAEWFALRGLLLHIWMAEKDILNAELTLSSDWIELLRCGNMHVGDKEMSSLSKQCRVSLSVSFDGGPTFRDSAWPWRGSSPSWPGPPGSGATGNITELTSVSTLWSLLTQMASRWVNKYPFNKITTSSSAPQAGRHNKYIVKKARWEEHLRTMKEEEDMITEIYRQYKVTLMLIIFPQLIMTLV